MAQTFVFANNVNTTLADSATSTQTTLTLSSSANFPTIPTGAYWPLTLNDRATEEVYEIVYVSSYSGAVVTCLRGQEGTSANSWLVGDYIYSDNTALTTAPAQGNPATPFQTDALTASGLITANGGVTVPSGETLTVDGNTAVDTLTASGLITANDGVTGIQVSSISALEAFPVPTTDGLTMQVLGYSSEGDGGGGTFFWNASSTATSDGATVVLPTGYTGTGRWIRQFQGSVNILWWGADKTGATDSSTAIQNAHNYAVANGYLSVYFPPNSTYLINSTITWSMNVSGWTDGFTLIETTSTTLSMLFHISSQYGNAPTFAEFPTFKGPFRFWQNAVNSSLACFYLGDIPTSTTYGASEFWMEGIEIYKFSIALEFSTHAYIMQFYNCFFNTCSAAITSSSGAVNYGEKISFIGCVFSSNGSVFNFASGEGIEAFFDNCSIDYNNSISQSSGNGTYTFTNCHIEWNDTANPLLLLYDPNLQAEANFNNCVFNFAGASAPDPLICQIGGTSKGAFLSVYGCTYSLAITGITLYNINAAGSTFFGPSLYRIIQNAPGTYVANSASGTLHTF